MEARVFSLLKKVVPMLVTGLLIFSLFACSPATNAFLGQSAQQRSGEFHQIPVAGDLPRLNDLPRDHFGKLYRRRLARRI